MDHVADAGSVTDQADLGVPHEARKEIIWKQCLCHPDGSLTARAAEANARQERLDALQPVDMPRRDVFVFRVGTQTKPLGQGRAGGVSFARACVRHTGGDQRRVIPSGGKEDRDRDMRQAGLLRAGRGVIVLVPVVVVVRRIGFHRVEYDSQDFDLALV